MHTPTTSEAVRRTDRRWRATDVVGTVAAALAALGAVSYLVRGATLQEVFASWVVHNAPLGIVGSLGMAVALRHQPNNRAARFLFVSSVLAAVHVATLATANALAAGDLTYALVDARGAGLDLQALPPVTGGLFWISTWIWVPAAVIGLVFGMALLPDGRWPSPRWRRIEPFGAVATAAFALSWAIYLWPGRNATVTYGEPPHGSSLIDGLFLAGGLGIAITAAVAVAAVVVRLRRVTGEERRRLRPVGVMALLTLVAMVLLYPWQGLWAAVSAVLMSLLLVSITLAMTRHRLFDVEVLVSRAVTAALLAAFVTVVYVGVVAGVGYLLGDRDNLGLALAATALVAVGFEPLRRRVSRWTRRLVLGTHATPEEVLGRFSDGLAGASSTEDMLVQVAELLVAGTGATRAEVRTGAGTVAVAGDGVAALHATRSATVRSGGQVLGEVVLAAPRVDLLLPADEELLARVAALLGPVLRNAALTDELQHTVDELRASRQRLVLAEETIRRSVERDIHDGAQQQLLGLRLKLGLAGALADQGEPERVKGVVAEAAADTDAAIRGLRDLARGLHPPVLEQEGLVAALRARLRSVPLAASVEAPPDLPRWEPGVESAVYLCCLEAIQNVTKHARATTVTVRLAHDEGVLTFAVTDDGRGFGQVEPGVGLLSIRDRVEALDGTLDIDSTPGRGTTVSARIPAVGRDERSGTPAGEPAGAQPPATGSSPVSLR